MAEPIRWQDAWWHQQPDGTWLRFDEQSQQWEPVATVPVAQQPVYQPQTGMTTGGKVAVGLGIALGVLLILAILAAIAIPVFLRQREEGYIQQVESALKNAATAEEAYLMNNGTYADSVPDLEGFESAADVEITVERASDNRYCLEGRHDQIPDEVWAYDSVTGRPRKGPCV